MALSAQELREIRGEIGDSVESGKDDDAILQTIYDGEGNSNILLTCWWVWKRRLGDLQTRAFDVTTGGALLSRRQRISFIERRIAELEFALGSETLARSRATQWEVLSTDEINALARSEFS